MRLTKRILCIALKEAHVRSLEAIFAEMTALAETLDMTVVGCYHQEASVRNPSTLIGSGKVIELKEIIDEQAIDRVLFFQELSNTHIRNLEEAWDIVVLDRTLLIFELLAERARTKEAKLLVSIAQMKYLLPRLTSLSISYDRQQGGIGLRGPGETKLERSRRRIETNIAKKQDDFKKFLAVRTLNRRKRQQSPLKNVAIMGYTNAGKSTLLNTLLKRHELSGDVKDVLVKNQVFSTLETHTRLIKHPNQPAFTLTDTLGFVSHLPKSLHQAFLSTLEEIQEADLLIVVLDASTPYLHEHIEATNQMIQDVNAAALPRLYVFNKMDLIDHLPVHGQTPSIYVSLETEENVDGLCDKIYSMLFSDHIHVSYRLPFDRDDLYYYLRTNSHILNETLDEESRHVEVKIAPFHHHHLKAYAQ